MNQRGQLPCGDSRCAVRLAVDSCLLRLLWGFLGSSVLSLATRGSNTVIRGVDCGGEGGRCAVGLAVDSCLPRLLGGFLSSSALSLTTQRSNTVIGGAGGG